MFEESASAIPSSIWASMNSWFTPTVFFVLLNVMIGTIAFTSKLTNQKQRHNRQQNEPQHTMIARSPSSLLQRLKSTNFYPHYTAQEPQNLSFQHKPNYPDSDSTLFNLNHARNLETQSHYFFQEASHQEDFHISQSQPTYLFEQTHQQNPQETQTQFVFEQKDLTLDDFDQTQFIFEQKDSTLDDFEQTHQQNRQETQSQFVFEQKDSTLDDFDQTKFVFEQKDSTLDDFEQTHQQNPQETQSQFVFEQKDSTLDDFEQNDSTLDDFEQAHEGKVEENEPQSMDEVYSQLTGSHVSRSKSDTKPASGETPPKLPARMKKSASLKSAFGHFDEENTVEARRPATVREGGNAKITEGDDGVDAKADDFINKFKYQLKLQRLDSIIRYKDMIGRGRS